MTKTELKQKRAGNKQLSRKILKPVLVPAATALLLCLGLIMSSCGDTSRVRITGNIEEGAGKMLWLDKLEVTGPVPIDSVKPGNNGKFTFRTSISIPSFYRIRIADNNFITLLAEPGERINIEAVASNLPGTYTVEGSEGSELLKKLNDRLIATKRQIDPLLKDIIELEEGPGFEEEEAKINEELEEIIREQRNFSIAFILDNMESLAAITALYQQLDDDTYVLHQTRDIQYLKIVAESLMKLYPSSPHVRALAADAENQERAYEAYRFAAMAEQSGNVVTTYPDINMPGTDGENVSLYSLPEKYKLVFFGSSLNQASVQFAHDLIPVYNAFRQRGFQVYQVSVERDREEWLRSIEFSELPWVHVAELGEGSFSAAQAYNVQQIPANYLINRDVGIVARNLSVPELRRRLARVLD